MLGARWLPIVRGVDDPGDGATPLRDEGHGEARDIDGTSRSFPFTVLKDQTVLKGAPWSLAGRRLPQFYLVSFWIDDPGKLPVLGIVDLLEHVAAFFA